MSRKSVSFSAELHELLKSRAEGLGVTIPTMIADLLGEKAWAKDSFVTMLIDNDGFAFYTKIPPAIRKRFAGIYDFAISQAHLKNGEKAAIFKSKSESVDGDCRSGFMIGSQQKKVYIDKKIANWLNCRDGDRILWKMNESKVWLEKYNEA